MLTGSPAMSLRLRPESSPRPSRFAAWRPFVTGVLVGLAFLVALGTAMAQGIDHAPFDALLKANVKNGVVSYSGFQDNAAFKNYVEDLGGVWTSFARILAILLWLRLGRKPPNAFFADIR